MMEMRPKSLSPAPHIIAIPAECPSSISTPLTEAFGLYWTDLSACANRLRYAVEKLLDHLSVPSAKTSGAGKSVRLNLAQRLDEFQSQDSTHTDELDALRIVGNVGSHGRSVEWEVLLDAFQIFEHALDELVGKRSAIIKQLARKIKEGGGSYKRPR